MSPAQYVILTSAVTMAEEYQIRSVAVLRRRLAQQFHGADDDIDQALKFWGAYEAIKRRNGVRDE